MIRYLGLYVIALAGLIVGANPAGPSFLVPLSLAVLLFGALGLWRLDKWPFRDLGFPKEARWLPQLALSTLAGIGIVMLSIVIALLARSVTITTGQEISASLPPLIFRTFVYTALIATSEELIFRGAYFQVLRGWRGVIVAAVASAALWAAFHLPGMAADNTLVYQMVIGMLTFVAFGTALAFAAVLAGSSLWVPIGIHYGYNLAFSSLGAFFSVEISGAPFLSGAPGWFPETGIIGVIVWMVIAAILFVQFRRNTLAVEQGQAGTGVTD
jgi:membrane protease YdiL (CAAX protease family)